MGRGYFGAGQTHGIFCTSIIFDVEKYTYMKIIAENMKDVCSSLLHFCYRSAECDRPSETGKRIPCTPIACILKTRHSYFAQYVIPSRHFMQMPRCLRSMKSPAPRLNPLVSGRLVE